MLETYVKAVVLLAAARATLERRAGARRDDDAGLATLEWVALAVLAVTLATVAYAGIRTVIERKISQIP